MDVNSELNGMRANEFINEGAKGSIGKDAANKSQGVTTMRDVGGYDRTYHLNRIMMAAAMSDGSGKAVDMDSSSWGDKYNTAHPYTDAEHKMMQAAFKTIPSEHQDTVKRSKSKEADDTYTTSPVNNWNKK
jgi:hypothetical protein